MTGALHPQLWWWVARATGIVAWSTATAAVLWGLMLSGRFVRRRRLPAWLLDLHRYLGTLTLAFVAVHVGALVADSYVHFGWREIAVPMASEWRPGAVTWGVLALYGLVVVEVSSWAMRALPRAVWHGIHGTSYAVFATATVHAVLAGADRDHLLFRVAGIAGIALVTALTVARVLGRRRDRRAARARPRPGTLADRTVMTTDPPRPTVILGS